MKSFAFATLMSTSLLASAHHEDGTLFSSQTTAAILAVTLGIIAAAVSSYVSNKQ